MGADDSTGGGDMPKEKERLSKEKVTPNKALLSLLRNNSDKEEYAKVVADLYTQEVQVEHDTAISLMQELNKVRTHNLANKKIEEAVQKLGENIKTG